LAPAALLLAIALAPGVGFPRAGRLVKGELRLVHVLLDLGQRERVLEAGVRSVLLRRPLGELDHQRCEPASDGYDVQPFLQRLVHLLAFESIETRHLHQTRHTTTRELWESLWSCELLARCTSALPEPSPRFDASQLLRQQ
jgi:hypothetical protein